MTVERFPETLAVVRLGPGAEVPAWAESSSVFAIIATATETTLVCAARSVPTKTHHERPFTAYRTERGTPAPKGARTIAAFDHDWVLVPADDVERAEEEWRRSGLTVEPAVPTTPGEQQ